uniref:Testin n=1 Tax=Timema cristinae TaxID=61476 RepID=A0A7R9CDZ6_TIMCR|nr:unnamed protein product [Timema cristinae]
MENSRKLCRNCKCKKEDHDVKDDDGYEQFHILLGTKKNKIKAVLKISIAEVEKVLSKEDVQNKGGVPFDWVPPNAPEDVVAEYMRHIPVDKLPISGSEGAVYRRQQLERQVPLHDLDASKCDNLSQEEIEGDSMPKSAHIIQHHGKTSERLSKLSGLEGVTADVDLAKAVEEAHLECQECAQPVHSGEVAVFAERAGENAMWHPQCFTCHTCKELLVDLVYFFYKSNVYCGRHFADLLNIPRCFACDELIFVKEYTMAEEHAFHVKHFCCFECDVPLGGKKYVVKHDQPICLSCYAKKYGKKCYTCGKLIAAEDQRVSFNDFHWHVTDSCFCCHQCSKPLAGRKFVVKKEQPLCSSECVMEFLRLNN